MVLVLGQDGAQRVLLVVEPGKVDRRSSSSGILELFSDVGLHPSDVLRLQPLIIRVNLADGIQGLVVFLQGIGPLLSVGPGGFFQGLDLADCDNSRLLLLRVKGAGAGDRRERVPLLDEPLQLEVGVGQLFLSIAVVLVSIHGALCCGHLALQVDDPARDVLVPANVLECVDSG
ncbi:hypothetical protein D3C76_1314550 [compost metagenome]